MSDSQTEPYRMIYRGVRTMKTYFQALQIYKQMKEHGCKELIIKVESVELDELRDQVKETLTILKFEKGSPKLTKKLQELLETIK